MARECVTQSRDRDFSSRSMQLLRMRFGVSDENSDDLKQGAFGWSAGTPETTTVVTDEHGAVLYGAEIAPADKGLGLRRKTHEVAIDLDASQERFNWLRTSFAV